MSGRRNIRMPVEAVEAVRASGRKMPAVVGAAFRRARRLGWDVVIAQARGMTTSGKSVPVALPYALVRTLDGKDVAAAVLSMVGEQSRGRDPLADPAVAREAAYVSGLQAAADARMAEVAAKCKDMELAIAVGKD